MSILGEIKEVGLGSWLWYKFLIHEDEFHKSLQAKPGKEISIIISKWRIEVSCKDTLVIPAEARHRAHEIEIKLDDYRYNHPPCLDCGARTRKEANKLCHCGGDKDDCHGCHLWPD